MYIFTDDSGETPVTNFAGFDGSIALTMGLRQHKRFHRARNFAEANSTSELITPSKPSDDCLDVRFDDHEPSKMTLWTQICGMLAGNLFHLSGGYAMGFTSPTLDQLRDDFDISMDTATWVASTLMIGYIIGCGLGGPISDIIGRRRSLQLYSFISICGWMMVTFAQNSQMLLSGRFVHGLADSLAVAPAILFVAEVSHVRFRGVFMTFATICATLGVPIVYIIGSYVPWRYTAFIGATTPFTIFGLLAFSHESPIYLMKKGLVDEAWNALVWYRGQEFDVGNEICEIRAENEASYQEFVETKRSHFVLVERDTIRPACIAIGLMGLLPMSGLFNITFFAADIIKDLGFDTNQNAMSVVIGLLRTLGCAISVFTIQKYGRRRCMLVSAVWVTLSMSVATLGVVYQEHFQQTENTVLNEALNLTIVGGLFSFMFSVGMGMNPVPWILLGEWFTPVNRAFINSCGTALFFGSCLITIQV
eukprot:TCALIF_08629-PA protein Name:"Similar to Tret1 Facilitated trehalose transporter Tret1 (Apis mellifera ligustica)" AED:0.08 eAED:0.08 QI:0/1/0.5/1/1/1/4/0/476